MADRLYFVKLIPVRSRQFFLREALLMLFFYIYNPTPISDAVCTSQLKS